MTRRLLTLILPLLLMGNTDCDSVRYEVDLKPRGNRVERVLTLKSAEPVSKRREHLEKEDVRVAAQYPSGRSASDAKGRVFRGSFVGKLPEDVGGAGWFRQATSLLGSTSDYAERFRGNDDAGAQVKHLQGISNAWVNHLDGWLASELKGQPGAERLHGYLDTTVRTDAANLLLHLTLLAPAQPGGGGDKALDALAGLYLTEHGYLDPDAVGLPDSAEALTRQLRRVVVHQLAVVEGQPTPHLDFLSTPARAEASLQAYLRTTADFAERQRAWNDAPADQRRATGPDPMDVLSAGVEELSSGHGDSVSVVLHLRQPPFSTNGHWDSRAHTVGWDRPLTDDRGLPAYCLAQWSEPDPAFQKKHFGKVVLDGHALSAYVQWRQTLPPDEGKAWDDMLQGLKPGPGLKAALESFHGGESGLPAGDPWGTGRRLLLLHLPQPAH